MSVPTDELRNILFSEISNKRYTAIITAAQAGRLYGVDDACAIADEYGITVMPNTADGMFVHPGETIMTVCGSAQEIAFAEENIIGKMAKASGIATAASSAVHTAKGRVELVCGSFKKVPSDIRMQARKAIESVGVMSRVASAPFVYLDKNYVRMLGGIQKALEATKDLDVNARAIQIFGYTGDVGQDAILAVECGADVLMIDTGKREDIDRVLEALSHEDLRGQVKIAFAGDVELKDIDELADKDIDRLCIGKALIDAPLLDMRLSVISEEDVSSQEMPTHLLNKTEINIENIELNKANLSEVARVVAEVLGFEQEEVLVIDVRDTYLTIDILKNVLDMEQFVEKEQEIIDHLKELDGITVCDDTRVTSEGVLGLIAYDHGFLEEEKELVSRIVSAANEAALKRILVIPTGFELQKDMIEDTNSAFLKQKLESRGYKVDIDQPAEDSIEGIVGALYRGVNSGYSTIFTTGGVGAEDKDFTVEAVQVLDEAALTPWLARFRAGHGRHKKSGVKIAVGEVDNTLIISLPGPNDEVRVAYESIEDCFAERDKYKIARNIAMSLRNNYKKTGMV